MAALGTDMPQGSLGGSLAAAAAGAVAAGAAWFVLSRLLKRRDVSGCSAKVVVVLGGQWGDEGKGKLVDILAQTTEVCARFNGGANAGHTLVVEGKKYAFHLVPCGMMNRSSKNLIGNGVVVHIPTLLEELAQLKEFDPAALSRLFISDRAAVLLDTHREIDGLLEAEKSSSKSGALGVRPRGMLHAHALPAGPPFAGLFFVTPGCVPSRRLLAASAARARIRSANRSTSPLLTPRRPLYRPPPRTPLICPQARRSAASARATPPRSTATGCASSTCSIRRGCPTRCATCTASRRCTMRARSPRWTRTRK